MSLLWAEPPASSLFADEQVLLEVDPGYAGPGVYAPRRPQQTVLYKLVQDNLADVACHPTRGLSRRRSHPDLCREGLPKLYALWHLVGGPGQVWLPLLGLTWPRILSVFLC
jgi:hypothetical protein